MSERYSWQRITHDLARVVATHPRWLMVRANREWLIRANVERMRAAGGDMVAAGYRLGQMQDALDELVARDARRRLP